MQIERLIVKGKGPERAIIITKVKFSFEELHYLVSELTVLMVFQLCCPALQIGPCSRITKSGNPVFSVPRPRLVVLEGRFDHPPLGVPKHQARAWGQPVTSPHPSEAK